MSFRSWLFRTLLKMFVGAVFGASLAYLDHIRDGYLPVIVLMLFVGMFFNSYIAWPFSAESAPPSDEKPSWMQHGLRLLGGFLVGLTTFGTFLQLWGYLREL